MRKASVAPSVLLHGTEPYISITVHPSDQMSHATPYPLLSLLITSGAIQYGVPTIELVRNSWYWLVKLAAASPRARSIIFDAPKSASLTTPERCSSRLSPLMSRWITGGLPLSSP